MAESSQEADETAVAAYLVQLVLSAGSGQLDVVAASIEELAETQGPEAVKVVARLLAGMAAGLAKETMGDRWDSVLNTVAHGLEIEQM